jgi:hypothetical protein
MNKNKFLIGADPEVFLVKSDDESYGISAIGLIPGTKRKPHKITKDGHCIQVDNVLAEFNIPARNNPEDTFNDILICLKDIEQRIGDGLKVLIKPSLIFHEEQLNDPKALEFGCDPDFNVYERAANNPPNPETNLRTAGGHVHIGYEDVNISKSEEIVKLFDLYLTLPSILEDTDTRRRVLYGKSGCFRFKDYGVECRQLSNYWISSLENVQNIYNRVEKIFEHLDKYGPLSDIEFISKMRKAIDSADINLTKKIINERNNRWT